MALIKGEADNSAIVRDNNEIQVENEHLDKFIGWIASTLDGMQARSPGAKAPDDEMSEHLDTKIYWDHQLEKLNIANSRRIFHWYQILEQLYSKIQFPAVFSLFDTEELHEKDTQMLQRQIKEMLEANQEQNAAIAQLQRHVDKQDERILTLQQIVANWKNDRFDFQILFNS